MGAYGDKWKNEAFVRAYSHVPKNRQDNGERFFNAHWCDNVTFSLGSPPTSLGLVPNTQTVWIKVKSILQ